VTVPAPDASPAPTSDDSLALAAREGIHRLPVPTPFLVGRVNCYLVEDEPLTLVDTGPNSGKSLDELERALAEHGRTIEELGLIVITHQHMDHLGLLEVLVRRSGADVAAFHELTDYLANFSASAAADDEFAHSIMRLHGVPEDLATVLGAVGSAFRAFGSSGQVTRPLRDGETLALRDRRFRILHRPGHSPSDTIFFDEDRRILLGGDHLLARISSNPLISRPLTGDRGRRPPALIDYMESMRATRELPIQLVLPGHGGPISDHGALIDERFRMHQRRAAKVLGILAARPLTAYEIALEIWGNVAVTQAYLTLSEVLGHLDLLVRDGQARENKSGGVIRFESLDSPGH
jgi:glyoxylase-like metal-dependent hydrolase (beta-lactamase superfamily II)